MEKGLRGLTVHIYRCSIGNCTNGPSQKGDRAFLILENNQGPNYTSDPSCSNLPIFKLDLRIIRGEKHIRVIPYACNNPFPGRPGFGGNFLYSSDSRFPHDYPIPIHDRFE